MMAEYFGPLPTLHGASLEICIKSAEWLVNGERPSAYSERIAHCPDCGGHVLIAGNDLEQMGG